MARLFSRAVASGRGILSMECALVCLLVGLSIVGNATDLDRKVRMASRDLIAGLSGSGVPPAVRGVPIPKDVAVHVTPVQAQAVRAQ